MQADQNTENAVLAAVRGLSEAYARRDINRLLSLVVLDDDLVMYGTGADEKRIGRAELQIQAERDWSQSDEGSFEFGWSSVSCSGSVAWIAADCTANITLQEQAFSIPLRFTGVLENRGGKWLFAQMHFSAPLAGQNEGESFPT